MEALSLLDRSKQDAKIARSGEKVKSSWAAVMCGVQKWALFLSRGLLSLLGFLGNGAVLDCLIAPARMDASAIGCRMSNRMVLTLRTLCDSIA